MTEFEKQAGFLAECTPTPEELRHKRQVSEEIDKIEEERAVQGDTAFLNKEAIREMADDRLRRERRGGAQSGSTTAPNGAADE